MVLALRELVAEFGIPISHMTEQSMHNKVYNMFMYEHSGLYFLHKRTDLMVNFPLLRLPLQDT